MSKISVNKEVGRQLLIIKKKKKKKGEDGYPLQMCSADYHSFMPERRTKAGYSGNSFRSCVRPLFQLRLRTVYIIMIHDQQLLSVRPQRWTVKALFLGVFAKLRIPPISFVTYVPMSACPSAWINSAPTGRIFMKFNMGFFFRKTSQKIQVAFKSDKNKGYLTWRPMCIYDSI
jgi:hypothetical protein